MYVFNDGISSVLGIAIEFVTKQTLFCDNQVLILLEFIY